MNYESQKVTKTFTSNVGGFRLRYTVVNPVGGAISDVSAIISKVTVETVNEQQSESLERVGSGCVTTASNRNYLSFDKLDTIPHADRLAISEQYLNDINGVLTDTLEA